MLLNKQKQATLQNWTSILVKFHVTTKEVVNSKDVIRTLPRKQ